MSPTGAGREPAGGEAAVRTEPKAGVDVELVVADGGELRAAVTCESHFTCGDSSITLEVGVDVGPEGGAEDMPLIEAGLEGEKDIGDVEVVGAELEEIGDVEMEEDDDDDDDDDEEVVVEGNRGDSGTSSSSCAVYLAIFMNVRFGSIKSASVTARGALFTAACRRWTGVKPSSTSRAKLAVSTLLSTRFAALLGHLLCWCPGFPQPKQSLMCPSSLGFLHSKPLCPFSKQLGHLISARSRGGPRGPGAPRSP